MMHRALARVAVAAVAATVAGMMAAAPAAAEEKPSAPEIGKLTLNIPEGGVTAGGIATKDCGLIPGGAKVGVEGWVFDNPVRTTLTEVAYLFGIVVHPDTKEEAIAVVAVTQDGAKGIAIPEQELKSGAKALSQAAGSRVKALAAAGDPKAADDPKASGILDGLPTVPLPAGVSGALVPVNGGVWLRTPPGTIVAQGLLLHAGGEVDTDTFDVKSVCAPAAAPGRPAPPVKAPGAGGGSGESLPVTGTNVGIVVGLGALLVALGGALLFIRRRRATTFVA
jgi:LPXTG-motif cell wall-anchored protein